MTTLDLVVRYYREKGIKPSIKSDKTRLYPTDSERASCCDSIREPSRAWPYTLYKHCFTAKHIRTRIQEKPTQWEKEALDITIEEAPLHINDTSELNVYVAQGLLRGR